jgi:hypothetical protein
MTDQYWVVVILINSPPVMTMRIYATIGSPVGTISIPTIINTCTISNMTAYSVTPNHGGGVPPAHPVGIVNRKIDASLMRLIIPVNNGSKEEV